MDRKYLIKDQDTAKRRCVINLAQACMDTPASAKCEGGYGYTAGFIDSYANEDQIVFLDRMDLELAGHLNRLRISCLSRYISVARLSWWAAGDKRQIKVFEALAHDVRVQDKLPTAE
ncbi:hypothetical protein [Glutamicibacter sp. TV12E]|uniref:hypothetical protein n=1 Tax=Glutamicibacter sp. TV12E TaxID=3446362 RepID=UPI0040340E85